MGFTTQPTSPGLGSATYKSSPQGVQCHGAMGPTYALGQRWLAYNIPPHEKTDGSWEGQQRSAAMRVLLVESTAVFGQTPGVGSSVCVSANHRRFFGETTVLCDKAMWNISKQTNIMNIVQV